MYIVRVERRDAVLTPFLLPLPARARSANLVPEPPPFPSPPQARVPCAGGGHAAAGAAAGVLQHAGTGGWARLQWRGCGKGREVVEGAWETCLAKRSRGMTGQVGSGCLVWVWRVRWGFGERRGAYVSGGLRCPPPPTRPPYAPPRQVYVIKPGADQQSVSLVFPLRFSSRQERAIGVACMQVGKPRLSCGY